MKINIIEPGRFGDLKMLLEVALDETNKLENRNANQHNVIAVGLVVKKSIDMWLGFIPVEKTEVPN